ncbi:MAG TPA: DUF488 domain-containing protein [Candidatus Dependentiae bacterium]|nr:DUF488 domain-containing protein [Candidatus Dependentiae bacterium]
MLKIKRIYDKPEKKDGIRILVDRLWPRGLSKEKAKVDLWMKEIAPSNELRKKFGHEEKNWQEFKSGYEQELSEHHDLIEQLVQIIKKRNVTFIYAAKNTVENNAIVLEHYLRKYFN